MANGNPHTHCHIIANAIQNTDHRTDKDAHPHHDTERNPHSHPNMDCDTTITVHSNSDGQPNPAHLTTADAYGHPNTPGHSVADPNSALIAIGYANTDSHAHPELALSPASPHHYPFGTPHGRSSLNGRTSQHPHAGAGERLAAAIPLPDARQKACPCGGAGFP
jgi:hypothetical protein